ncbi:hypothetical protein [Actinomadura xylanilytica]|uniref:hypothetical protein n=1 Tax=Actinomadura xylanilytica TaxID=887459 RepID=UPI00255B1410|nr:hypothetical protein [Actinomadura xylanilytica]MDL4776360.1 hypothetical protein [Actinomadura xylanilytica]
MDAESFGDGAGWEGAAGSAVHPGDARVGDQRFNAAMGPCRLHLAALDAQIVSGSGVGELACGVVSRGDGPPVLNVIVVGDPERSVEVTCARVSGVWWFVLADTGEGVARVDEVADVPGVLVRILGRG